MSWPLAFLTKNHRHSLLYCVSGFEELSGSNRALLILKYVHVWAALAQPEEVKIRTVPDVRTSGRGEPRCHPHHRPAPLCQRQIVLRSEDKGNVARYISKVSLNPFSWQAAQPGETEQGVFWQGREGSVSRHDEPRVVTAPLSINRADFPSVSSEPRRPPQTGMEINRSQPIPWSRFKPVSPPTPHSGLTLSSPAAWDSMARVLLVSAAPWLKAGSYVSRTLAVY